MTSSRLTIKKENRIKIKQNTGIKITKSEAASRQIDASIKMFLEDYDSLAVHTVVCAGSQIISDLLMHQNKEDSFSEMLSRIKEEYQADFAEFWRNPQNFLKHSDKDPQGVLQYVPDSLEFYLMIACQSYTKLTGTLTPYMGGFMTWFFFRFPDIILDPTTKKSADEYVARFGAPKSSEDKLLILEIIKRAGNT